MASSPTVSEFLLIVGGHPHGKGRPKFGHGRAYTPRGTKLAEAEVKRKWEEAGEPRLPDDTALRIDLTLYVVRPAGHFKRDGELSAEGLRCPRPWKVKPDCDNALKTVTDALNRNAYRDDVRLCEVHIERHWADWPAVKIKLSAI